MCTAALHVGFEHSLNYFQKVARRLTRLTCGKNFYRGFLAERFTDKVAVKTENIGVGYDKNAAAAERSDVCAVCAAEIVLESVAAFALADVVSKRLGGDNMQEVIKR